MIKIIVFAVFAIPTFAFASFSTSARKAAVVCKGNDLQVTLNVSRTAFSTLEPGDDGHPQTYKIIRKNSDGDSFVSFIGKNAEGVIVALILADEGAYQQSMSDVFELSGGATTSLRCK